MSRRLKPPLKSGRILLIVVVIFFVVFLWFWSSIFPDWWSLSYQQVVTAGDDNLSATSSISAKPEIIHLPTPSPLRALYMTQCAATSPSLRNHLLKLADETEINAIVVDIKDYSGTVIFPSPAAIPGGAGCADNNFADLVKTLHEHNLYVIGRLTVFQDPLYTKTHPEEAVHSVTSGGTWRDHKGLAFVDVSSKPFWDYVITLSREAYALGVDEINFDYIRYPSDGNMADVRYLNNNLSKPENLELFFKYLTSTLHPPNFAPPVPVLSADLFGMTTTNYDDLNIGQVLERALPYFDYIGPMVYPSHYPPQFNGWADPNQHPYDIVYYSLSKAIERTEATTTKIASLAYTPVYASSSTSTLQTPPLYAKPSYNRSKIRPWLQDFNYPVTYTAAMVKAQIQATYDLGLTSWMMWDPANKYTSSVYQPIPPIDSKSEGE